MSREQRGQAIREMRRRHSAKAEIRERLAADLRGALERAFAETAGLGADDFTDVVHEVIVAIANAVGGKQAKRDRRIVDALSELLPLLEEMRSIARASRSEDRATKLRGLAPHLDRWRKRYEATDDTEDILRWLIDGDREPHQTGPKKRAAGIAYKVTARLPWARVSAPTIERIYRNGGRDRREGWWKRKPPKLIEPESPARSRTKPISVPGRRRRR